MKATTRLDAKGRVSIGKYVEHEPGTYYRIQRGENGSLTLTPIIVLSEETSE